MEARASVKFIRITPRKAQIVCDLIRGKSAAEAVAILMNTRKSSTDPLLKLLKSCMANAENNHEMNPEKLYVSSVFVSPGPILKRMMPRARGGAARINKRTCHISLVLAEKE